MRVRINGKDRDFDDIAELEDAIDEALDDERENAFASGLDEGKDIGFDEGVESIDIPEVTPRETDLRTDLYRTIYRGDIEGAEDILNMMAMIDIDRDLIWNARMKERMKHDQNQHG